MASHANASVVANCGCTPECCQPCSSVETQNRLRAERLGLMLTSIDARVIALQAKQPYIPAGNLPDQKSGQSVQESPNKMEGSTANGGK